EQYILVTRSYPDLAPRRIVHEVIRRMINRQIVDLTEESRARSARAAPAGIEEVRAQHEPLIGFSESMRAQSLELKRFLRKHLYHHYRVRRMTSKAARILSALFEAFMTDPGLLPPEPARNVETLEQAHGPAGRARAVADYIAGMTDRYAIAEYDKVYSPAQLT
ncbi:MAG: deoxyguanosinetriphosphate triphosphohydrolase, partial [Pseudomonadota bacterium]